MIQLLVNSVWGDAAQLRVTDSSDVETSDGAGVQNITSGPRHLEWTQDGTAERRLVYVEKGGTLTYDTVVVTRADRYETHGVQIADYATYTGSATTRFTSTNFAETLIGEDSLDYVLEIGSTISSKQAVSLTLSSGTGGAYSKTVNKFYACSSLELNNVKSAAVRPEKRATSVIIDRRAYQVSKGVRLQFEMVTDSQLNSLDTLYRLREEPFFIYDSSGLWLQEKLLHVVLSGAPVVKSFNDLHEVELNLKTLRRYDNA